MCTLVLAAAVSGQATEIRLEPIGHFEVRDLGRQTFITGTPGRWITAGEDHLAWWDSVSRRELAWVRTGKNPSSVTVHPTRPLVVASTHSPNRSQRGHVVVLVDLEKGSLREIGSGPLVAARFSEDGDAFGLIVRAGFLKRRIYVAQADDRGAYRMHRTTTTGRRWEDIWFEGDDAHLLGADAESRAVFRAPWEEVEVLRRDGVGTETETETAAPDDDLEDLQNYLSFGAASTLGFGGVPGQMIAFSADSRFVAASGSGATAIATAEGDVVTRLVGSHTLCSGESGSELWLGRPDEIFRWNADHDRRLDAHEFPEDWRLSTHTAQPALLRTGSNTFAISAMVGHGSHGPAVFDLRDRAVRPLTRGDGTELLLSSRMVWSDPANRLALSLAPPRRQKFGGQPQNGDWQPPKLRIFAGAEVNSELSLELRVQAAAFSPSGRLLALADHDDLWIVGTQDYELTDQSTHVRDLRWLDFLDDQTLLGHDGGEVLAWRLPDLDVIPVDDGAVRFERTQPPPILATTLSPDRKRLAVTAGNRVAVFELER